MREKKVVKTITAATLAKGLLTKYNIKIEEVGRREARTILPAFATETRTESS